MDIITTFNPPRMVMFGKTEHSPGRIFWVRAITQEDYAILMAWIDDVLPGQSERTMPPSLSSPEASAALESPLGWTVLAWIGLRHSGVDYETAAKLILQASPIEKARLMTVMFRKRPTFRPSLGGEDIGVAWWGPNVAAMLKEFKLPLQMIGAMTLDQMEMIWGDGIEAENPTRMTIDQVQAMWEAQQKVETVANGASE